MRIIGVILFLVPFLSFGQGSNFALPSGNRIDQLIDEFGKVDGRSEALPDMSKFIKKLEQKEISSSLKFCRTLFYKTRQEFFARFEPHASFRETLINGRYNCLTGTALYALLLHHFGIEYTIIETNYHIFLLASTNEGNILFEATDPLDGFVSNPQEIEKRLLVYKQNAAQPIEGSDKKYYAYRINLYEQVDLIEMSGLLHYNLSIAAYNQQNFETAIHHLDKALDLYNSPRIAEFSTVLMLSVMESKLDKGVKDNYLKHIQRIREKQVSPVARSSSH